MAPNDVFVQPQLATTHCIGLQRGQPLKLYVSAFSSRTATNASRRQRDAERCRVQCWTNLPLLRHRRQDRSEKEQEGTSYDDDAWAAVDLDPTNKIEYYFHAAALDLDTDKVFESFDASAGRSTQYALTWRLVKKEGEVEWLGRGEQDNVTITFVQGEEKHARRDDITVRTDAFVSIEVDKGEEHHPKEEERIYVTEGEELYPFEVAPEALRGLVIEQTKPTWHTSRSFKRFREISDRFAAALLVLETQSPYGPPAHGQDASQIQVYIPVCTDEADVSLVRRDQSICAGINRHKPLEDFGKDFVAINRGPVCDLHELVRRCFTEANTFLDVDASDDNRPRLSSFEKGASESSDAIGPFDGEHGLGVCTWDALRNGEIPLSLSALDKAIDKVELAMPGSVSALLIDDGWQDIVKTDGGRGQLRSFDVSADVDVGLECGLGNSRLAALVGNVKQKHSRLKDVGVWMTLAGYWDGLCPQAAHSEFGTKYGPLVEATLRCPLGDSAPREWTWWLPAPDKLSHFFDDFFAFLATSGVTFVKVDDQADWEWIVKLACIAKEQQDAALPSPGTYSSMAWTSMTHAAHKHFGPAGILHCMALGKRLLNGHQIVIAGIGKNRPMYVRTSDDTFPNVPAAHTWHIYHNATEAILAAHGASGVVPDADMITTSMTSDDPGVHWAQMHAAFRCIFSSATIWISDPIDGEDDPIARRHILQGILAPRKRRSREDSALLATVQSPRGAVSLPLPSHALLDLTCAEPGPALFMATQMKSRSSTNRAHGTILSIWNVRSGGHIACGVVTVADVDQALHMHGLDSPGIDVNVDLVAVFSHRRGGLNWLSRAELVSQRHQSVLTSAPVMPYRLRAGQWDNVSIAPAMTCRHNRDGVAYVACLGLIDKYAGLTAVKSQEKESGGSTITCRIDRADECTFVLLWSSPVALDIHGTITASIDGLQVEEDYILRLWRGNDEKGKSAIVKVDMMGHLNGISQNQIETEGALDDAWTVSIHL